LNDVDSDFTFRAFTSAENAGMRRHNFKARTKAQSTKSSNDFTGFACSYRLAVGKKCFLYLPPLSCTNPLSIKFHFWYEKKITLKCMSFNVSWKSFSSLNPLDGNKKSTFSLSTHMLNFCASQAHLKLIWGKGV
jgi:hypothetical protein